MEISVVLWASWLGKDFTLHIIRFTLCEIAKWCWLLDALREAQSQNKDLSRQVQELTTIRVQLQNERDGLSAELSDTKDALKDALARLEAANAALTQLRTDMEHRLREKDDEIDNIRSVNVNGPV